MELTDENQDGMDCRPLGRETGIETPAWLKQKLEADRTEAPSRPVATQDAVGIPPTSLQAARSNGEGQL